MGECHLPQRRLELADGRVRKNRARSRHAKSWAFTLVELLVVIGIIALLVAILLPSLSRARESAKSVQCLSNLRQIAMAIVNYTGDNKFLMPGGGEGPPQQLWDWIYWDNTAPYNDLTQCPLAKYIGINTSTASPVAGDNPSTSANVFRCPSDIWSDHISNYGGRYPYFFSYSINAYACDNSRAYSRMGLSSTHNFKITMVHNPSQKIMMVDECERTVNDGLWVADANLDQLADRHEIHKVPNNPVGTGNVSFFDGHAETVTRADAADPIYFDPSK
jgi:prepilin-type processing-associated H-X9-DG protein